MNFYDIPVKTLKGESFDLQSLKGKKILVVNTASECGYTPQYAQLEELFKASAGKQFTILAFPCDQFGNQEPGKAEQISAFCEINFGVTFPLMEKTEVKGPDAHPLFNWLTAAENNSGESIEVKWNFQKFLVDENGNYVKTLDPGVSPLDEEITSWVGL